MTPINAKESATVKRIRNRLQKHLLDQEEKTTQDALSRMAEDIRELLERKVKARDSLKKRKIVLFDKNRHPAKDKKATLRIREMIKRDFFPL